MYGKKHASKARLSLLPHDAADDFQGEDTDPTSELDLICSSPSRLEKEVVGTWT